MTRAHREKGFGTAEVKEVSGNQTTGACRVQSNLDFKTLSPLPTCLHSIPRVPFSGLISTRTLAPRAGAAHLRTRAWNLVSKAKIPQAHPLGSLFPPPPVEAGENPTIL